MHKRIMGKRDSVLRTLAVCAIVLAFCDALQAQLISDETPWEFQRYQTQLWLSVDPRVPVNGEQINDVLKTVELNIASRFGVTIDLFAMPTPPAFQSTILEKDADFIRTGSDPSSLDKRQAFALLFLQDMVVVIPRADEDAFKTVKSLSAIGERLESLQISNSVSQEFQFQIASYLETETDEELRKTWEGIQAKLEVVDALPSVLVDQLVAGADQSIVVPEVLLPTENEKNPRVIPLLAPWQMETKVNLVDKIVTCSVQPAEFEGFEIVVREYDTFSQSVSDPVRMFCSTFAQVPIAISNGFVDAFAPMGRLEESTAKHAGFRMKAGGLVVSNEHPARVNRGDLVVPIVRMDDKNGKPIQLEPLPWTYVAATAGNATKMYGTVIAYNGGYMEQKRNKRIERRVLSVKPRNPATTVVMEIRQTDGLKFPGADVYQRVPGVIGVEKIAQSDWRGIFEVTNTEPPEIHYQLTPYELEFKPPETEIVVEEEPANEAAEKQDDEKAPNAAGEDASETEDTDPSQQRPVEGQTEFGNPDEKKNSEEQPAIDMSDIAPTEPSSAPTKPKGPPKGKIKLNVPIYEYVVKNGGRLIAKFPVVTGYLPIETPSVYDDRRRLEAEALVKGVQNSVIDTIGRRQIYMVLLNKRIEAGATEEAIELLADLKSLPSYKAVVEELEEIQRRLSSADREELDSRTQSLVDKMFDTTRTMLQKYLDDATIREYELRVKEMNPSSEDSALANETAFGE